MQKKVGFVLEGISNLKIFGPLLAQAHRRQLRAIPLLAGDGSGGGKTYDTIRPADIATLFPHIPITDIFTYGQDSLSDIVKRESIEAVVFLNAYHKFTNDIASFDALGIKTFALDYFVNALYIAATAGKGELVERCMRHVTERLVISDYWRDLEFAVLPSLTKFADKFVVTSTPLADVGRYITPADSSQLQIPPQKRIVCLMAPNIRRHHSYYFYGLGTQWKIKRLLRGIQTFCLESNLHLVVKSRAKQWDSALYHKYADLVLDDIPAAKFPYTSALLLQRADLLIHFGSMAVLESATTHVPALGVAVTTIDKLHHYMEKRARGIINRQVFSNVSGSLFNFPQVSRNISINQSVDTYIKTCHSMINDIKATPAYVQFRQKYLGESSESATDRILGRITHHLGLTD